MIERIEIEDLRELVFKAAMLLEVCWIEINEYSDLYSFFGQCDVPLN